MYNVSNGKGKKSSPIPTDKIIRIYLLITIQCYFTFKGNFYRQNFGFPMGSPFSKVLACFFQEFLGSGRFQRILSKDATFFQNIDDALLMPPRTCWYSKQDRTYNRFHVRNSSKLHFIIPWHHITTHTCLKVYRKSKNNKDFIHFCSHHNNKIKSGIILKQDIPWKLLRYSNDFRHNAKRKAYKIQTRKIQKSTNNEKNQWKEYFSI